MKSQLQLLTHNSGFIYTSLGKRLIKDNMTAGKHAPVGLLFNYSFQWTAAAFGSWNGRSHPLFTAFVYCHRQLGRHGSVSATPPCGGRCRAPVLPVRRPVLPGPQGTRGPHPAGDLHAVGRTGGADGSREAVGGLPGRDEAEGAGERWFPSGHALLQGQAPDRGQSHLQSAEEDAQRWVQVIVGFVGSGYLHQQVSSFLFL